ncbi:TRAP-type C4-dicarboxylate transport system, small permease component [Loktanella fryxellensis]|uniref:TRAP transporter small permease protein n=1 Tax=Loktanella fryxellensis TaxID=245187 RepID=A0A1H8C2H1_9RHOB|nr:TRAP transporter small permease [Loktanella fryxellensis]SEM89285.1 TRAP-type C4-dicarboxylate transport system, small permease component [Loktanella fryxellensis]
MADDTQMDDDGTDRVPTFADAPVGAVLWRVANVLSAIGTIWIGLMMLLIVADVLSRNILSTPITGVSEIAGRSVVAIVFLQIGAAVMQGRLTRADFLLRRIAAASPATLRGLEVAFALTGALVFGLILWASWPNLISSWATADFFGVQGVFTIPTWPFRAITVIGCTVTVLACLYQATVAKPFTDESLLT